jgi:predicted acetyltransferase
MAIFLAALIAVIGALYVAIAIKKTGYPSSLLLKLLRKYHQNVQNGLDRKTSMLWSDLSKEYLNRRGWSKNHVKEMQDIMLKSYEDLFLREDIILTEKESAKEFLRRLLLCEKTFNQKAPLRLEETEKIYQHAEKLVRKVF